MNALTHANDFTRPQSVAALTVRLSQHPALALRLSYSTLPWPRDDPSALPSL